MKKNTSKNLKGIVLAGGSGSRLHPITMAVSKQLLPVYDKPMVYYPISTLMLAGIREILVITTPQDLPLYRHLLKDGSQWGVQIEYAEQPSPDGLAQAFIIGRSFIGNSDCCMVLGDNIFSDDFRNVMVNFRSGAHIFAKQVPDPERFGVVKFDQAMKATQIKEKPKVFLSDYAITGLYLYDSRVVEIARSLKSSPRGELEITDVHNWYLQREELKVDVVKGDWIDAGTFDALLQASNLAAKKAGTGA